MSYNIYLWISIDKINRRRKENENGWKKEYLHFIACAIVSCSVILDVYFLELIKLVPCFGVLIK